MLRPAVLLILLITLGHPASANPGDGGRYQWPVVGVVDGDTLKVHLPGLPAELQPVKVRVRGVDTPELHGKCASEKAAAKKAGAFTRNLVERAAAAQRPIHFSQIDWDKYGGRIDADVAIDGRSLADMLVSAGLARRYDGGRRSGWCG
ncbi:thermonuclease family protein [Dongia rigui]|uniref:Thermonuclease family protein n=1 Tax=Dongia rigui TaxID=940149 RepID=A0ABU5DZT0_9PROT|nr:thermonuclease family protein [Dongia rigui]MDY0872148.1 thermonuclease family protein [Dongia rigui]